ncbi:pentatricopeptide repeat-containing protein At5g15010, mitochondrial-like [Zingiber officinale]|nr:pentatricopeptide repeat-containing protein At5g15010, mitochondrial-like [Zingiber officinale]
MIHLFVPLLPSSLDRCRPAALPSYVVVVMLRRIVLILRRPIIVSVSAPPHRFLRPRFHILRTLSSSSSFSDIDAGDSDKHDDDDDDHGGKIDSQLLRDIDSVLASIRGFGAADSSRAEAAKLRLQQCGVAPSSELVNSVLSHLRNDWACAFNFFLWAAEQPGYSHSARDYHSMISILGKMRHFDTAWSLVHQMRNAGLVTPATLLILIKRYSAVHDVAGAINAFHTLRRFGITPGPYDFQGLLAALCRYKNVPDAEHLLLCNHKTFPFDTKSFNIVLNGWCSIVVSVREAKRFWRLMRNSEIEKDVVSYASMISCYSKVGNLDAVLKLFNQLKEMGTKPDLKIYNAVIHALAKGKCFNGAMRLLKAMEESGTSPNAATFNSLIRPLCKLHRVEDARKLFDEMLNRGLSPCVRTYHPFLDAAKNVDDVFQLLARMRESNCGRAIETYIMLIRKLSRWRQHESVFKVWNEMQQDGFTPDRSAYIVLIHGMFLNGKLEEAATYYEEMKAKGFLPEPKTEQMLQAWYLGKEFSQKSVMEEELDCREIAPETSTKHSRARNKGLSKDAEMRKITRERGFSLYE